MFTPFRILFRMLSVNLSQIVYPVIPRLYKAFEYFSTFEFLEQDMIKKLWNNLYVLVGVIVLFAIASKLISAMVNPDLLTDNKKGVKGVYLRTVIAVLLIFVTPFIFEISFDIQRDLLKNNFLINRIFGYRISSGTNVGQVLAWEAFSSFCRPITTADLWDTSDSTDYSLRINGIAASNNDLREYYAAEYDISNIEKLDAELLWDSWAELDYVFGRIKFDWIFKYNGFLCPLAGCLIAYEMILLCMDTMFRAAKLALLQLMLPIVLGAYVFNPEILKKWAKEFASTYLSLFLKVVALGFMVIALQVMKGLII